MSTLTVKSDDVSSLAQINKDLLGMKARGELSVEDASKVEQFLKDNAEFVTSVQRSSAKKSEMKIKSDTQQQGQVEQYCNQLAVLMNELQNKELSDEIESTLQSIVKHMGSGFRQQIKDTAKDIRGAAAGVANIFSTKRNESPPPKPPKPSKAETRKRSMSFADKSKSDKLQGEADQRARSHSAEQPGSRAAGPPKKPTHRPWKK